MKRASVMLLAAVAVLVISSVANAEMVYFSQNFDDTDLFPAGYAFGDAKGDAATTDGLWGNGGGAGDRPVVVTDRYHSEGQSIKVTRPSSTSYTGYRFYGTTTNGVAPFADGKYTASSWMNLGTGTVAIVYTEAYDQAIAASPAHTAPGVAIYADHATYGGMLKAWSWTGTAWAWSAYSSVVVSKDSWFDLKFDVDLDNKQYDILVDTGTGWSTVLSNVALNPDIDYGVDTMVFYNQGSRPSYMWVDDCEMIGPVPEPSTLALLASGLVGLLVYAWRQRK